MGKAQRADFGRPHEIPAARDEKIQATEAAFLIHTCFSQTAAPALSVGPVRLGR